MFRIRPIFTLGNTLSLSALCFLAFCLATGSLAAQPILQTGRPGVATSNCFDSPTAAGAFDHCSLTLKHGRLMRAGATLDRSTLLHTIPLSQFVRGDSAWQLARTYETQSRWSTRIALASGMIFAGAFNASHFCTTAACTSRPNRRAIVTTEIASAALFAISIPIGIHARHQGEQAVELYNASLSH